LPRPPTPSTGSGLAEQDFASFVGIARVRQDFGSGSYLGALYTGRELDGPGYNRVVGPDFVWRATTRDRVVGQVLWSETRTPERTDLAEEWDGRRLKGHGLEVSWNHQERRPVWFARYRDFSDAFRADTGFVPQVGYREGHGSVGWNLYPEGFVSTVTPQLAVTYAEDRDGRLLTREVSPFFFLQGARNLTVVGGVDFLSQRTGGSVLSTTEGTLTVQVDPSRSLTRLGLDMDLGEAVDLANEQVGRGGQITAFGTLRPLARLTLDLQASRRWLDVPVEAGGRSRLFTATVARAKALVHFSDRSYLRLIGQWIGTTSDPALYPYPVDPKTGSLEGSALFTYRLNWQTALYVGYGDERALDETDSLRRTSRQLFAKISYAFQR
jgi:hypothetical protein